MITSSQNKAKPVEDPAKNIVESIKGVLDDKKIASINKAIEKIGVSQDVKDLIIEIKALKETIESNNIREWRVEIERDKQGFITSLRYNAEK